VTLTQQERAYAAEGASLSREPSEEIQVDDESATFAAGRMIDWWQELHGRRESGLRARRVEVHRHAPQRRAGVAARRGDMGHIEVPGDTVSLRVLCHEVAHILTPSDRHGETWARVYLELVYRFEGSEAFVALHEEFIRQEVQF